MTDITSQAKNLYDAGVAFMVSSKTEGDAWKDIAIATAKCREEKVALDDVESLFKLTEDKIKADFGITTMPAKWRSAKSVALKAYALDINTLYDGVPVAKTALEKTIKAHTKFSATTAGTPACPVPAGTSPRPILDSLVQVTNDLANMLKLGMKVSTSEFQIIDDMLRYINMNVHSIKP